MRDIHRRSAAVAGVALAAVMGGAVLPTATPAGADERKAACVAVLTHDPAIGAPGVAQRRLHLVGFGEALASIAHQTKGECVHPFGGSPR